LLISGSEQSAITSAVRTGSVNTPCVHHTFSPPRDLVGYVRTTGFPVNPAAAMPVVNGCRKQDYAVLIVVGLPATH